MLATTAGAPVAMTLKPGRKPDPGLVERHAYLVEARRAAPVHAELETIGAMDEGRCLAYAQANACPVCSGQEWVGAVAPEASGLAFRSADCTNEDAFVAMRAVVGVEDLEREVVQSTMHHTVAEEASWRSSRLRDWRRPKTGAPHTEERNCEEEDATSSGSPRVRVGWSRGTYVGEVSRSEELEEQLGVKSRG